jgi:hypothetical protein
LITEIRYLIFKTEERRKKKSSLKDGIAFFRYYDDIGYLIQRENFDRKMNFFLNKLLKKMKRKSGIKTIKYRVIKT